MKNQRYKLIGEIGIDAGVCWIGDPCYILHTDRLPKAIGKDWDGFCNLLYQDRPDQVCKQFDYDSGFAGLGVAVSTGYGDGSYPVYAAFDPEGRIARICIEFIGADDA
jgi:hypothetical protein